MAEALRAQGAGVSICKLDGEWPSGTAGGRSRLADALAGVDLPTYIVDGLIAMGAPAEIEAATAAGRSVWVLLHMPPTGDNPLEKSALHAATGLLCTGSGTAEAARRLGLVNVHLASPGVDLPAKARPRHWTASGAPHFVMVGALLPNKDQISFVDALARIKDLAWTAALVGSSTANPLYAAAVRERIFQNGLEQRVELTGELSGQALEAQWLRADVSLLISHSESFGMVVQESLAHGIPVVVRKGTGAVEALGVHGAGEAVDLTAGIGSLETVLRRWLGDPALRESWRVAAEAASRALPRWEDTAREVLRAVTGT
ncbi:glycosyltransferase family 4 protein [Arthrobacter bambusae]|uniref:glycosyltransferase family 4 protein n=1 Tax=Arthrobacter bambusae TaxID=1338426 RepID=UPI002785FD25|nr:glycosyltransferase family 4 protein [Arthrobacter bambusae]MDQ0030074.1 glycosyltransferase involved in cell wall biosynthesis [Arthrobacter bambusae]MDQ0097407.1 glycosyltransferase involved in cell wall biosynthesis [Arthrobacter bambusae]